LTDAFKTAAETEGVFRSAFATLGIVARKPSSKV
jgi:hypothetical protein